MTSHVPDPHGDLGKDKGRKERPKGRLKAAHRAILRTLVYAGVIAASIVLWWAVVRFVMG